jgi:hypothetical protein
MLGLDAAGKTTILYKLHIGEVLSTVPTIGARRRGRRAGSPPPGVRQACERQTPRAARPPRRAPRAVARTRPARSTPRSGAHHAPLALRCAALRSLSQRRTR